MTREGRQRAILVGLLAVFAVVLWARWADPGRGGGRRRAVRDRVAAIAGRDVSEVADLRLSALEAEAAVYSPGRDPFSYGVAPRPEPPPPQAPPPQEERPRRRRPRQAQAQQPARPQPPAVDVTFLGSFGRVDDRIAVFSDGSDILNAKVGDVLKDKFIVDAIGFESADLKFVGFPDAPSQRLAAGG